MRFVDSTERPAYYPALESDNGAGFSHLQGQHSTGGEDFSEILNRRKGEESMAQQWPLQFNRRSFISGVGAIAAFSLANVPPAETAQESASRPASTPGAARRIPDTDEQRISDLVAGNHILFDQGVVDGFGHLSVRSLKDPTHYFMSQSRAPGLVARDDIMEFDLDSKPIDPRGRPMYGERFIHGEILRARSDVQSVVHSHASAVLPFTVTGAALRPMIHTAGFIPDNVPRFEIRDVEGENNGILIHNSVSGAAVAKALGNSPLVLMRGHGMAVVGPSVRHTVYRAIYTQLNAQIQLQAMLIGAGKINFLNPMEAANVDATNEGGLLTESPRQWDLWVAEAKANTARLMEASKP
jgi:ribulose-5-phosphate 4-epimerase/fuculose-1-phosphate aldolase